MKKVIRIGKCKDGDIFCKVSITDDGKLSISGVIGPNYNGDCRGPCGQIQDSITEYAIDYAIGWNKEVLHKFIAVWKEWHLNDMRPYCEHKPFDANKKIQVVKYTWGDEFHRMRKNATDGKLSFDDYVRFSLFTPAVYLATIHDKPLEVDTLQELIDDGLIKIDKTEEKRAGWVYPWQHVEGILCKPCPICGYKYGSAWNFEPLPIEVVEFLESLPNSDIKPPWV